jgi:DNA-binding MarR family transcriptional regulator
MNNYPGMAKFRFSDLDTMFPGKRVQQVTAEVMAAHDERLAEYGLTVRELAIMAFSFSDEPIRLSDLAERTVSDISSVSRSISSLVDRGLLRREQAAADRRTLALSLTAKGQSVFDDAIPAAAAVAKHVWADISDQERKQFDAVVSKIEIAVRKLRQAPRPRGKKTKP